MLSKVSSAAALLLSLFAILLVLGGYNPAGEPVRAPRGLADPVVYAPPIGAAQTAIYAATPNWYVSASGSANSTGTDASHPITSAELSRRLKGVTLTVAGAVTVHYDAGGDPNGTLEVGWTALNGTQVFVVGTPTSTGVTGTLTTWTNAVTTTTPVSYGWTDSALPAANSFTALVGDRIRITSGPRANECLSILKDENTNAVPVPKTARVATPFSYQPLTFPYTYYTAVKTVPVAGDPYVVETLPVIGDIRFTGSADMKLADLVTGRTVFKDINTGTLSYLGVTQSAPSPSGANVGPTFVDCAIQYFAAANGGAAIVLGGSVFWAQVQGGSSVAMYGVGEPVGGFGWSVDTGGSLFANGVTLQGGVLTIANQGFVTGYTEGISIWDATGCGQYAICLLEGGILYSRGPLYGSSIGGGVQFEDGAKLFYQTLPTITGGNGDWLIDSNSAGNFATTPIFVDLITGTTISTHSVGGGPDFSQMAEVTADQSLNSATFADVPGLSATVGTNVHGFLIAHLAVNGSALTHDCVYQLLINGSVVRGCDISATAVNGSCNIVYRSAFPAGSFVVKAQYKVAAGGTCQIRPVTHIEESAQLVLTKSMF